MKKYKKIVLCLALIASSGVLFAKFGMPEPSKCELVEVDAAQAKAAQALLKTLWSDARAGKPRDFGAKCRSLKDPNLKAYYDFMRKNAFDDSREWQVRRFDGGNPNACVVAAAAMDGRVYDCYLDFDPVANAWQFSAIHIDI